MLAIQETSEAESGGWTVRPEARCGCQICDMTGYLDWTLATDADRAAVAAFRVLALWLCGPVEAE